ncbi:hypothetical protein RYX36_028829, partial [Vicia faba]
QSPTNTILIQRLDAHRTIITANQDNVEYILKTNFKNFPKGKPFIEILGDFSGKVYSTWMEIYGSNRENWQVTNFRR